MILKNESEPIPFVVVVFFYFGFEILGKNILNFTT